MEREEKLHKLADVLMMAASKAREMSDSNESLGRISRETALSRQLEGIALEFRAIADDIKRAANGGRITDGGSG